MGQGFEQERAGRLCSGGETETQVSHVLPLAQISDRTQQDKIPSAEASITDVHCDVGGMSLSGSHK